MMGAGRMSFYEGRGGEQTPSALEDSGTSARGGEHSLPGRTRPLHDSTRWAIADLLRPDFKGRKRRSGNRRVVQDLRPAPTRHGVLAPWGDARVFEGRGGSAVCHIRPTPSPSPRPESLTIAQRVELPFGRVPGASHRLAAGIGDDIEEAIRVEVRIVLEDRIKKGPAQERERQ